jgi:hypothetical protein
MNAMTSRSLCTAEELTKWITDRLNSLEGCQNWSVSGLQRLKQLGSDGCNWSDSIVVNAGGAASGHVRALIAPIVIEARQRFNLA